MKKRMLKAREIDLSTPRFLIDNVEQMISLCCFDFIVFILILRVTRFLFIKIISHRTHACLLLLKAISNHQASNSSI